MSGTPPLCFESHTPELIESDRVAFEHRARAMDAAVPVDAKNASTSDLDNRTESGFPQRPQPSLLSTNHEMQYHHPA